MSITIINPFGLYRDSIIFPILAGDAPQQRRLFDSILNERLPVVLECKLPGDKIGNTKIWFTLFVAEPILVENVYLFANFCENVNVNETGYRGGETSIEIGYNLFVIR